MNSSVLSFVKNARLRGRIVDVGAYNVNGAVKDVIPTAIGIDMRPGKGVDKVMPAEIMDQHFENLDAVTCCETLEHVEDWRGAMAAMWRSIKTGGRMVLTVPQPSKGYHAHPEDYWRWSFDQVKDIFRDQKIEQENGSLGCSWGVVAIKQTADLNLAVEPAPIEKRKERHKRKEKKGRDR